jgi:hypothetical protein
MNIGGIGTSVTQALAQVTAVSSQESGAAQSVNGAANGADESKMSGPGQIMAKLKDLQQSDPAKFKQVMQAVSESLKEQAQSASDPQEQKALTQVAGQFAQAAQSGDLSALRPQGGQDAHGAPPAGGPPPATGGGKAASSSASTSSASETYEPADTNQDGTVSLQEREAYAAKQAASGTQAYRAHDDGMAKVFAAVSAAIDDALGSTSA